MVNTDKDGLAKVAEIVFKLNNKYEFRGTPNNWKSVMKDKFELTFFGDK